MDRYEATKVVFARIQNLDPENASKIMGLLLIQDHGEKEMSRLALGPESLLHSLVLKARQELGISPNTPSTPSTPSSPSHFFSNTTSIATSTISTNSHHPLSLSRQNSTLSPNSSRLFLPNGLKIPSSLSVSSIASPSSASSPSPSWGNSIFPDFHNPDELISPSNSSAPNYLPSNELIDEIQLQEQLSFLNDSQTDCPTGNGDSLLFPYNGSPPGWGTHRRSYSVSDISLGSDDPTGGLGWKPCLYYAKGYCKNGTSCRFLHHHNHNHGGLGSDPDSVLVGSPTSKLEMMEHCHELLRSKSMQQNRLLAAVQLMHGGGSGGSGSFSYCGNKCSPLSLLAQQQQTDSQRMAAALMMGEDTHKFGRSRLNRGHYLMNSGNGGDSNPGSRQIYLTFPADSTFREEDVSNYFSIFGPVQDVRIPYQQKRMFGFVTFVYPETVRMILAKGNPHFVCDARVLVKPYKEKGKVPDKFRKQQFQQLERADFSACSSPTGLDSRDPFDRHLGVRMMSTNTEDYWRKKLEDQAELQQALDLQNRRLMGLTLDLKRSHHQRALSSGAAPFPSPSSYSPRYNQYNQFSSSSDRSSPDGCQENGSVAVMENRDLHSQVVNGNDNQKGGSSKDDYSNSSGKVTPAVSHDEDNNNLPESLLDHNLPDSPFASPTKGSSCDSSTTAFASFVGIDATDHDTGVVSSAPNSSKYAVTPTMDMAPFKSCIFQMPRFATGHSAIEM